MDFLQRILGVVILDDAGERVFAKYYRGDAKLASLTRQRALELSVQRAVRDPKRTMNYSEEAEIIIVDGYSVLFMSNNEVTFMVIGSSEENEIVLATVLHTFIKSLKEELNVTELSKRDLLERYDAVLLTVDEMLDDGIILETDVNNITAEVLPYIVEMNSELAHKALSTVNKYLRETF